jgi:CheY-like chemotaxis protein
MTLDDLIKLLDALGRFVSAVAIPGLLLLVVLRFGPALRDFLANLGEFTLKGGGFEATAKRNAAEAAGALVAATLSRSANDPPEKRVRDTKAAASAVAETLTPEAARRAVGGSVLWVDDHPDNNIHERAALEAVGLSIVIAESTDNALQRLQQRHFEVVISDMGREGDPRAGYTLLDHLRQAGNRVPYIIYAGSASADNRAEARRHGAIDSTNRPEELFRLVLGALSASP